MRQLTRTLENKIIRLIDDLLCDEFVFCLSVHEMFLEFICKKICKIFVKGFRNVFKKINKKLFEYFMLTYRAVQCQTHVNIKLIMNDPTYHH